MPVTCAYKKECAAENGCIFPVKFFRGKHQRGTLCCLVAARIVKLGISRTKGIGQCVLPSAWNDSFEEFSAFVGFSFSCFSCNRVSQTQIGNDFRER
jgi:hypothetical protein